MRPDHPCFSHGCDHCSLCVNWQPGRPTCCSSGTTKTALTTPRATEIDTWLDLIKDDHAGLPRSAVEVWADLLTNLAPAAPQPESVVAAAPPQAPVMPIDVETVAYVEPPEQQPNEPFGSAASLPPARQPAHLRPTAPEKQPVERVPDHPAT